MDQGPVPYKSFDLVRLIFSAAASKKLAVTAGASQNLAYVRITLNSFPTASYVAKKVSHRSPWKTLAAAKFSRKVSASVG